ncbi:MAG: hypothetical protein AAF670_06355 [Planctomycetota bacterium]
MSSKHNPRQSECRIFIAGSGNLRQSTRTPSSPYAVGRFMMIWLLGLASNLSAADLEMVDAFGNTTGVVDLSSRGVTVYENNGARWFYRREPRYDLRGGRYLGFYSFELNRAIRFPSTGVGPIERADLGSPLPQFTPASVTVRLIGSGRGFVPYLDAWQIPPPVDAVYSPKPITPPGTSYGDWPGIRYPGLPMIGGGPASPLVTVAPPTSLVLETKVEDLPALPKVEIKLINTQPDRLRVTLTDAQNPAITPQYDLPPGGSQRVMLPRDAGQVRVQTVQSQDLAGQVVQREVRVNIPPSRRFEIIVHRWRIQSIAIDRTGKSPQPIEDVQFQGVGVGRFSLPPGDQLTSGTIDVFAAASGAQNAGMVTPIVPTR